MKFSIDKESRYCVFKLEEEKFNSLIAPKVKAELSVISAEGNKNLILDLSAVQFIDSSGLSAILVGNRLCKSNEGTFVLAGVQNNPFRLLKISQLDSVLNIVPTVSEAVDLVMMEEVERDFETEG